MNLNSLTIKSFKFEYRVEFNSMFDDITRELNSERFYIIDKNVAALYNAQLQTILSKTNRVLIIEANEENKTLEKINLYVLKLIELGMKRNISLVAIGGGVIQDITSFIAGVLFRGIDWYFYPTTLLAQSDSCIGSKSSINVGAFKNQVGTFTPPKKIIISTEVLATLSQDALKSGIGEMIKVHLISGKKDFEKLANDFEKLLENKHTLLERIYKSLLIKQKIIELDEFDTKERLILNYGHSFGHAIESATNYNVPHGIAVTIGMDLANFISLQYKFISDATFLEIHRVLKHNYLGFENSKILMPEFMSALSKDKKNSGQMLALILMKGPGEVFRDWYEKDKWLEDVCLEYFEKVRQQ